MSNTKELSSEELKKVQIGILDKVAEFCCENSITYFLSSGSLIGAIRHNGFIPWDDDIDLYMLRDDFERFTCEFKDPDNEFRVLSLYNTENYPYAYAKVDDNKTLLVEHVDHPFPIGVNIDVFPLDGVPDDAVLRKQYFKRIEKLRRKILLKNVSIDFNSRGILKNLALLVGKILLLSSSVREIALKLDSIIDKHCNQTKYVCNLVMGNGYGTEFRRVVTQGTCEVKFEGKMYTTMKGYDEYLRRTYGDYMQLPPEEKRVTHHAFNAYWK